MKTTLLLLLSLLSTTALAVDYQKYLNDPKYQKYLGSVDKKKLEAAIDKNKLSAATKDGKIDYQKAYEAVDRDKAIDAITDDKLRQQAEQYRYGISPPPWYFEASVLQGAR